MLRRSKRTGQTCRAWAVIGTNPPRCRHHCGRKTAVIKAELAAHATAERIYATGVYDLTTGDHTTVLDELLAVKDQVLRWNAACETSAQRSDRT